MTLRILLLEFTFIFNRSPPPKKKTKTKNKDKQTNKQTNETEGKKGNIVFLSLKKFSATPESLWISA